MHYTYTPRGVCSRKIDLELENGVVTDLSFTGGCNGNLKGICALSKGKTAEEIIALVRGIDCGGKGTSCPDQLSYALEAALKAEKEG